MTPSNSRDKIWTVNCCTFGNRSARDRCRRAVRMLHMHEYPQPQAFSCLRHRFDKPAQPLWRVRNQVTRRAAERDLGKAQECGGPEVCGCSRQHLYVQFYEKTECHKDTSQLLMLETQPSSGGGGGDFAEFVDGVGAGAVGFGGETAGTAGRSCGTGIVDGSNGLWTVGSGTGDDAATTAPSRIFL